MNKVMIALLALALGGCGGSDFSVAQQNGMGGEGPMFTGGTGGEEPSSGGEGSHLNITGGSEAGGSGGNGITGGAGGEGPSGGAGGSTGGSGGSTGGAPTGGSGGDGSGGSGGSTGGAPSDGGSGGGMETGGTGGGDPDPVCTPGDGQCVGTLAQVCDDEGQWETIQDCPFVCAESTGLTPVTCVGSCTPGAKQCSNAGDVQTCDEYGRWQVTQDCPAVCSNAACSGSCTPGAKQCAGDTVQTCNSQGQWASTQTCDFLCSAGSCAGVCEPGATSCQGDTPRTCNSQGQWSSGSSCPFLCTAGSCTGVCEPGSKRCNSNGTQTCNSSGQWGSISTCPSGPHQSATCSGNGICGTSCDSGYADCTAAAGCESSLNSVNTCGSCSTNCNSSPAHAAPICTAQGCDFVCDEGWGDVNGLAGDGCEADIYNDPENCGEPGHSCYGGSCTLGICEFEGIEEVAFIAKVEGEGGGLMAMAYDNGYLFGAYGDGTIFKTKADGTGPVVSLATGHFMTFRGTLVAEDGDVFWASDCGGQAGCSTASGIYKVSQSGGTVTKLSNHAPKGLDVENGYVYWNDGVMATSGDSALYPKFYRVSVAGGLSTNIGTMASTNTVYARIKVVGPKVYFVRNTTNSPDCGTNCYAYDMVAYDLEPWAFASYVPMRIDHEGNSYSPGGSYSYGPIPFDIVDGNMYWVSSVYYHYGMSVKQSSPLIGRSDITGDELNFADLITINGDEDWGDSFVADDSYVYFSNGWSLMQVGVNGGTPAPMTPHAPRFLTQDDSYMYWANWSLGNSDTYIFRMAK